MCDFDEKSFARKNAKCNIGNLYISYLYWCNNKELLATEQEYSWGAKEMDI